MLELTVKGMTCNHCVKAVTEAASDVPGVTGVDVDLPTGRVRIEGSPDPAAVRAAIAEEGYEPA